MCVPRSTVRYCTSRAPRTAERERLKTLASEKTRWGYRFLHTMLRREGYTLNRKVTYRLYREERLGLRRRGRRRRRSMVPRRAIPLPTAVNDRWSIDFVTDSLMNGRRFRALTIVDDHSRECPAIEVDTSLPAERVIAVLERVAYTRGFPKAIVCDNGPEFISRAFDQWAYARSIQLLHIEPGKPVQNAFIESFNGTFREECLNQHWFVHLRDARTTIESYRVEYNTVRPHSALGYRSPEENQKLRSVAHAPGGASAFVHSQDWMKESNIKRKKRSPQPAGLT
jgi:putative transposase